MNYIDEAICYYKDENGIEDWYHRVIDTNPLVLYEDGMIGDCVAVDFELTDPDNPSFHMEARVYI